VITAVRGAPADPMLVGYGVPVCPRSELVIPVRRIELNCSARWCRLTDS